MSGLRLLLTFSIALGLGLALPWVARANDAARYTKTADLTRFLRAGSFEFVRDEHGQPIAFSGGDEKYLVQDQYGNRYKLRFQDSIRLYAEITAGAITDAIGLPQLTVYPAFALRGSRGEWLPATIQPLGRANPPRGLSVEAGAELTMQLLLNAVLGNHDLQFRDGVQGNLLFVEGHFVTVDQTHSFRRYDQEAVLPFDQIAAQFLVPALGPLRAQGWNPNHLRRFTRLLNLFITRLEKLPEEALTHLFRPYFHALPEFDYASELRRRIQGARSAAGSFAAALGVPTEMVLDLRRAPLDVPAPLIKLPVPGTAKPAPVDLLWATYFQPSPTLRIAQNGAIPALLAQAKNDTSRIYAIATRPQAQLNSTPSDAAPQLHLNPLNPETLVVVPLNDTEALTIARVAELNNTRTLALQGDRYPHGGKLDAELEARIRELHRQKPFRRLAIVELPENETGREARLARELGVELVIIDHHRYATIDRTHPLSSLEQTAQMLGVDLTYSELAVGIKDRAFLYGLADLGVTKEDVSANPRPFPPRASRAVEYSTRFGKVVALYNPQGGIGQVTSWYALREYPNVANILMIDGQRLRFSGHPAIEAALTELAKPLQAEGLLETQYAGGDPTRSRYWGAKSREPGLLNERVLPLLEAKLKGEWKSETPEPLARTSTAGTTSHPALNASGMLARGSAAIEDKATEPSPEIRQVIRAITGSALRIDEPFAITTQSITLAVVNSIVLAREHGHRRLAIPFIGGRTLAEQLGLTPQQLAELIVTAALESRQGLEIRFVVQGPDDQALFKEALAKLSAPHPWVMVDRGQISNFKAHGATAIVATSNMEAQACRDALTN